jgi:hypothetical protein
MYAVDFNKQRALEIIAAIKRGDAIPAPALGWNRYEMLHVAGAMHFALFSQGPIRPDMDEPDFVERLNKLPLEYREATDETLSEDVRDAIEFYSHLTMMIQGGEYDDKCESRVKAFGKGNDIKFISGAKQV